MRAAARVGCGAAMVAASLGFALFVAELGVRLHQWAHGRAFLGDVPFLIRDDRLGWRPNGPLRVERVLADAAGTVYRARVTTAVHGFRRFPEVLAGKPRILLIGDSFTHAVEVDDERTYHALLARGQPDHEVFAIGAGGYGTLQEALLLERSYPLVRPAIVIWQLCANDLTNNLFEAERHSVRHNNLMRRPYWEQGEIVVRNPAPWPLAAMEHLHRITGLRLLDVLRDRAYRVLAMLGDRTDPDGFGDADGPALRARAIAVTETILSRSRARHPHSRFLSLNVCGSAEEGAILRAISEASGFHFLGDYGSRIADRRRPGFEVFSEDGHHFNEHGHALLATMLADDFDRWRDGDAIGIAHAH